MSNGGKLILLSCFPAMPAHTVHQWRLSKGLGKKDVFIWSSTPLEKIEIKTGKTPRSLCFFRGNDANLSDTKGLLPNTFPAVKNNPPLCHPALSEHTQIITAVPPLPSSAPPPLD